MQTFTIPPPPLTRYCSTTNIPINVYTSRAANSGMHAYMRDLSRRAILLAPPPSPWRRSGPASRKKSASPSLGFEGHTAEIITPLNRLPDVEIVAYWDSTERSRQNSASGETVYATGARCSIRKSSTSSPSPTITASAPAAIIEAAKRKINVMAEKPLAIDKRGSERRPARRRNK